MKFEQGELEARPGEDFEAAWMRTIDLLPPGGFKLRPKAARPHPVQEVAKALRACLLSKGFDECELPLLLEESEVEAARATEFPVIAPGLFYSATLPRAKADVNKHAQEIRKTAPTVTSEKLAALQQAFDNYTASSSPPSRLLEELVGLGLRMEQATRIASLLLALPRPESEPVVFRDSLASAWFRTVASLLEREPLPLQLFSTGVELRRDVPHPAFSASFIIVDENVSLEDGNALAASLLKQAGFAEPRFDKRAVTSKLFVPGTEMSVVIAEHDIGTAGMLSPIALAKNGVPFPVFAATLSIDRLAALKQGLPDPRYVVFPQFSSDWVLSDKDVADLLTVKERPSAAWAKNLAAHIVKTCELYNRQQAPCEFRVAEQEFEDMKVQAWLTSEEGTLAGQDFLNELFVINGSFVTLPPQPGADEPEAAREARARGVRTGIKPLAAFADMVAARIEADPLKPQSFSVGVAKDPADVNIFVPEVVRNYSRAKKTKLELDARLFVNVETRVKRMWRHVQPR
jgi:O-phosphoseryl-tRNA(Cys) synthetase